MKKNADAAAVLQALGDGTRRAMIEMLILQPASVSALAGPLNISLTAVAQHLEVLENSGLVNTEKRGRVRFCRLNPVGFKVLEDWLRHCRSSWEHRLERLDDLLSEEE